jgi:hypothetical protein
MLISLCPLRYFLMGLSTRQGLFLCPPEPARVSSFHRVNVEDYLRRQLQIAATSHNNADNEFWRAARAILDLEHEQKVELAGRTRDASRRVLLLAIRRLSAHLLEGTIPYELRPAPSEPDGEPV